MDKSKFSVKADKGNRTVKIVVKDPRLAAYVLKGGKSFLDDALGGSVEDKEFLREYSWLSDLGLDSDTYGYRLKSAKATAKTLRLTFVHRSRKGIADAFAVILRNA